MKYNSDQCYILIADELKTIFFWIGKNINVRFRFIGVKECQKIRDQLRPGYKITSQIEGDEDSDFIKFIESNRFSGASFPYIYNPPSPPDDLDAAAQTNVVPSTKKTEDREERICKHCGAPLDEGVSVCPNCKEKN